MFRGVVSLCIFLLAVLYFDLPGGFVKIQHKALKYRAILHTETSYEMYESR